MVKKSVLCWTAEKKIVLIRYEKNCTFKLAVKKSLIRKKNHSPPGIKWSAPYHHRFLLTFYITQNYLSPPSTCLMQYSETQCQNVKFVCKALTNIQPINN